MDRVSTNYLQMLDECLARENHVLSWSLKESIPGTRTWEIVVRFILGGSRRLASGSQCLISTLPAEEQVPSCLHQAQ